MKSPHPLLGRVQIVLAFVLAGSSVTAGKLLVGSLPPFTLSLLSLLAAFVLLLPVLIARRAALKALSAKDLLFIALQAFFGMALFRVFMLFGLARTSAVHAGVITSLGPLLMTAGAALFLRERPKAPFYAGLALATAGILALRLSAGVTGAGTASLGGDLLLLAAMACEAAMSVIRKRHPCSLEPLPTSALIVAASIVLTLPWAIGEWAGGGFPAIDLRSLSVILYYGAFATAVAYFFWASGSARVPGTGIALAMAAMPISAVLLSALVLGELPSLFEIGGLVLGLAGMAVGQISPKPSLRKLRESAS